MAIKLLKKEMESIGSVIQELRIQKKISQEALAEDIGIHRTYLSDVELGKRNVSAINIIKIARALKVKPYTLLKEVD